MKKVICVSFIISISMQNFAELLSFEKNETWEYQYNKTSSGYTERGPGIKETITGTIVLRIDSIKPSQNNFFLYVTKYDSMQKNITYGNRTDTSTIQKSLHLEYTISNDTMVETTSGSSIFSEQLPYLAFCQHYDTTWETAGQKFERKTVESDTFVDSFTAKMHTRTTLNSHIIQTSAYYSKSIYTDTLVWLDNIGLIQTVTCNSQNSMDEKLSLITHDQSMERITLLKHNGNVIKLSKTSVLTIHSFRLQNEASSRKKMMYFSINGRKLDKSSVLYPNNSLIIQKRNDYQTRSKKILKLNR